VVDGQTVALAQVRHDARRDRLLADAEVHLAADPPFAPELGDRPLEVADARHLSEQSPRIEAARRERPHYEPPARPRDGEPNSDPAVRKGGIGIDSSLFPSPPCRVAGRAALHDCGCSVYTTRSRRDESERLDRRDARSRNGRTPTASLDGRQTLAYAARSSVEVDLSCRPREQVC